MFQKILVPLDGSKLAECALSYAEELAKSCGTEEVILVTVTDRIVASARGAQSAYASLTLPSSRPMPNMSVAVGKKQRQGQRYLDRIAKGLQKKGISVRTEVLLGNPAEEITSFAEHDGADVIVMSSHGRSGPSRWAYGSVADKIFRASCAPILMVRVPGCMLST